MVYSKRQPYGSNIGCESVKNINKCTETGANDIGYSVHVANRFPPLVSTGDDGAVLGNVWSKKSERSNRNEVNCGDYMPVIAGEKQSTI